MIGGTGLMVQDDDHNDIFLMEVGLITLMLMIVDA